jgi:transposase
VVGWGPKAITATAHKLARIMYALVRYGGEYVKQSQEDYELQNRERLERGLRKRAKELGYEVVKKPDPAVAEPVPA